MTIFDHPELIKDLDKWWRRLDIAQSAKLSLTECIALKRTLSNARTELIDLDRKIKQVQQIVGAGSGK